MFSKFCGSFILFFSLKKTGPETPVLSAFFLSLEPRWFILPLMGLWPCQLKMRNRSVLPRWPNEEPGMEMRIKHALKVFSSQPIVLPLSLVTSGSLARCQEKVTCQTDTPCSSNRTQKHTLNLFSLLSSCQSKG